MNDFRLESESVGGAGPGVAGGGTVSTIVLARELGVSAQTVKNWCKVGMPHTIARDGTGRYVVDLCRAWAKSHKPGVILGDREAGARSVGGRREGAGRKPRLPVAEFATAALPTPEEAAARKAAENAAMLSDPELLKQALAPLDMGGMSTADAQRRISILNARLKQLEVDEAMGLVLNANEVEAAIGRLCTSIKTQLTAAAGKCGLDVVAALGLPAERAGEVGRVLEGVFGRVLGLLAEDPLGELRGVAGGEKKRAG